MYCKRTSKSWAVAIGCMLFGVPCALAQIQPKASPAVNRNIQSAGPAVMDMRLSMQQPTLETSQDNNLLMTGNVAGAKHFRAYVPYRASSALQATMPTDSLNSFLRLSQQQDYRAYSPTAYTPYYSATATATHTEVGQPGIITPEMSSQMSATTHYVRQTPLEVLGLTSLETMTPQEDLPELKKRYTDENWAQTLSEDLLWTSASPDMDHLLQMSAGIMQMDVVLPQDVKAASALPKNTDPLMEIYDTNGLDAARSDQAQEATMQDPNASEMMVGSGYSMTSKIAMQAYAQTKFNTFMKAGETYLKQGEYDKAVDAYSLASVYQSGHVLAIAGKSHALLASRAYSSSALYLIRALNVLPDYAKTDMGLSDLLGGIKVVKGHIDRLESYTERKYVPELKLLLAFIYVQVGDFGLAQKTLEDVPPDSSYEIARVALLEASRSVMH